MVTKEERGEKEDKEKGKKSVSFSLVVQNKSIPDFVRLDFFQDESEKIVSMVNDLENNVILATLIVFLVIYSFMGKKSSFLVSLSITFYFFM